MNEPKRIRIISIAIVLILAAAVFFNEAYGTEVIQSNDMNAQTAGDLAISGSRSYGLSSALGDVDIGDCLASKQISILIIWQNQWVVENPLCVARELDSIGAHNAAAKVRCQTVTIKAVYPIESECLVAVMARQREVIVPMPVREDDDEDDRMEALYARIAAHEDREAKQVSAAEKAADRAIAAAQRANQAEIDRKEDAQQTLEAYKEAMRE